MYRFTTTMLISALALSSQLAHGGPAPDALSMTVKFADLDLTRSAGAAVLYERLKGAAQTVCAPFDARSRDLQSQVHFKQCVQSAIGTAVARIDRPALTAYYRAQFEAGNEPTRIAQK
jgi:UrcA family protein